MKVRPANARPIGVLVLTISLLAASPLPAWAATPVEVQQGNYRGKCRQLTNQIEHYEGTILPMAVERGNEGWESATNAQIARLWHRRADLCPEFDRQRSAMRKAADQMRKFNKLVATAAKAAASYFTGGLTGLP